MAADLKVVIDPSEEVSGTPLMLVDPARGMCVTGFRAPPSETDEQWASSADTEGELLAGWRYRNRLVEVDVQVRAPFAVSQWTAINDLQAKVGKLQREGGTLRVELPDGRRFTFDVRMAAMPDLPFDQMLLDGRLAKVPLEFTCRPAARGPEEDLGDNIETVLPVLVFTETAIKGDVPGLGRLVIDEDGSQTQKFVVWGMESKDYSPAATAALFYQAESCPLGTGFTNALTGASGVPGNNVVLDGSLSASTWRTLHYVGSALASPSATHIGVYRLFARVQVPATNTGTVSFRLEWAVASGPTTANPAVSIDPSFEGTWRLLDLGQVSIPRVKRGRQLWSGALQAKSTVAGDDIYSDWIMLIPVEASAEARSAGLYSPLVSGGSLEIGADYARAKQVFSADDWGAVPVYYGDYLKVLPAGLEGRTVRFIVKASRAEPLTGQDSGIDDISARLFVTPRYLLIPGI